MYYIQNYTHNRESHSMDRYHLHNNHNPYYNQYIQNNLICYQQNWVLQDQIANINHSTHILRVYRKADTQDWLATNPNNPYSPKNQNHPKDPQNPQNIVYLPNRRLMLDGGIYMYTKPVGFPDWTYKRAYLMEIQSLMTYHRTNISYREHRRTNTNNLIRNQWL